MNAIVFFALFAAFPAFASECIEQYNTFFPKSSKCESSHALTTGAGAVSPSVLAVLGENPAGLAYNRVMKGHIAMYQSDKDSYWRTSFVGADGMDTRLGTGIGGGIGIHRLGNSQNVPGSGIGASSSASVLSFGGGAEIKNLNIAVGGSARAVMSGNSNYQVTYPEANSRSTIGLLFNPARNNRLGISAHDVNRKNSLYEIGVSTAFGKHLFFTLEGMVRSPQNVKALARPCLGFSASKFQFSVGGNFAHNSRAKDWSQSSVIAGLAFWAGKTTRVVVYHNRIEWFYMGLTYDFTSK